MAHTTSIATRFEPTAGSLVEPSTPQTEDAAAQGRSLSASLLLILGGLSGLGTLATNILLPSLPGMAREFGVTAPAMGVTLSAFFVVFAMGQLVVGPFSDRFGRRGLVLGGLIVFVAGSILCSLASSLSVLIAGRITQAVGVCAASVLARAIARDLFEGEALARVLALTMVAMAAAPGFSPLLGGALDHLFGWKSAFLTVALLGAIVAVTYAAFLGETHHPTLRIALAPVSIARAYGRLALDRRFIMPAAAVSLLMGSLFAVFTASPAILMDGLGFSAIELGLFFATTVFLVFAAGMIAPRLAHRCGADHVVMAGLVIALLGAALLLASGAAAVGAFEAYGVPVAIFLFGMGLANPLGTAIALSPFGERAGLASALLGFLQMAAAAIGATLATSLPFNPVASVGSVLTFSLTVASILLVGRSRRARRAGIFREA
jgi:MFS transporter, DHA1 family, multidrug resistance protein